MIYLLVAFLVFTHSAAFGFGCIFAYARGYARANHEWLTKDEWKRVTRGWGAWMAQKGSSDV